MRGSQVRAARRRQRITKQPEVRRGELLDIAEALFAERGYDATPVSAIIDCAGLSKGAFYHYFESKEDLLDVLAGRVADEMHAGIAAVLDGQAVDAVAKLNAFFIAAGRWKAAHRGTMIMLFHALYRGENLRLRNRLQARIVELERPMLRAIIEQGAREGVFDVRDADAMAELLLALMIAIREGGMSAYAAAADMASLLVIARRQGDQLQDGIERLLRAPAGSVRLYDEETLAAFADSEEPDLIAKGVKR